MTMKTQLYHNRNAFENQFLEDIKSLCDAMRDLGNPFTDTEGELLHIISKTIMAKESVDSVKCPFYRRKPKFETKNFQNIWTICFHRIL